MWKLCALWTRVNNVADAERVSRVSMSTLARYVTRNVSTKFSRTSSTMFCVNTACSRFIGGLMFDYSSG